MEGIRKLDRDTPKVIINNKAMQHQESNANLYLQKSKGGRGLMEVESVYELNKIKVAHYVSLECFNVELTMNLFGPLILSYSFLNSSKS